MIAQPSREVIWIADANDVFECTDCRLRETEAPRLVCWLSRDIAVANIIRRRGFSDVLPPVASVIQLTSAYKIPSRRGLKPRREALGHDGLSSVSVLAGNVQALNKVLEIIEGLLFRDPAFVHKPNLNVAAFRESLRQIFEILVRRAQEDGRVHSLPSASMS